VPAVYQPEAELARPDGLVYGFATNSWVRRKQVGSKREAGPRVASCANAALFSNGPDYRGAGINLRTQSQSARRLGQQERTRSAGAKPTP